MKVLGPLKLKIGGFVYGERVRLTLSLSFEWLTLVLSPR